MSSNDSELRITPKRVGLTALATFCAACFWYRLHMRFRMPFDMFAGGIFKQAEQAEMAVFGHLLEREGGLPKEFGPFRDIDGRVDFPRDWRQFQYRPQSGLLLYGEPDEVCSLSSGGIAILDHKTAKPKNGEDPFLPCYQCQTIGYGLIAEQGLELGEVRKAGLIYWAAAHEDVVSEPEKFYRSSQMWLPFAPKPVAFDVDYEILNEPIKEALRLWKAKTPPEHAESCRDAPKIEALFALQAAVEQERDAFDRSVLAGSGHSTWVMDRIRLRRFQRDQFRRAALTEIAADPATLRLAEDGVLANWQEDWELSPESL